MFNFNLMKEMGIIEKDENGEEFISRVIKKLKDLELNKKESSKQYLDNIERLITENKIVIGSPILKNILHESEPVSSCTVVPIDLRNDLDKLTTILEPYAGTTMGSGYDLDTVDNPCETIEKISTVIHKLIQIYPNRLSAMGTLSVTSPEILNYVKLKRMRDFDTCHYNISVKIPDDFFKNNREYEILVNGQKGSIDTNNLLKEIAESIHCCGEPGLIFEDRFKETNPFIQKKYEYKTVAPCAEIAMAEGEVCQFSYINLSNIVNEKAEIDKEELKLTTQVLTRMLDNLCDISIKNAKANPDIIEDKRRIGVGVCGFADMLAKLKIPYDSEECNTLSENLFTFINFYSKIESVKMAKERGCFRAYNDSLCGKKEWYDRFRKGDGWVRDLDWQTLMMGIERYGIRNSSTTAIPPTGRSATIVNSSYSIEPYFSLFDSYSESGLNEIFINYISDYPKEEQEHIINTVLKSGNCGKLEDKYNDIKQIFKTATEIQPEDHIKILSTINGCIDESISKTINLPNNISTNKIYEYIIDAYKKGLNGITFFRDGCLQERNLDNINKGDLER